jgi:hypothetical protein
MRWSDFAFSAASCVARGPLNANISLLTVGNRTTAGQVTDLTSTCESIDAGL